MNFPKIVYINGSLIFHFSFKLNSYKVNLQSENSYAAGSLEPLNSKCQGTYLNSSVVAYGILRLSQKKIESLGSVEIELAD
jgi:hypothetical protein